MLLSIIAYETSYNTNIILKYYKNTHLDFEVFIFKGKIDLALLEWGETVK